MLDDTYLDGRQRRCSSLWTAITMGALALLLAVAFLGAAGAGAAAAKKPTTRQCEQLLASRQVMAASGTTPASVLSSYAVLRRPQAPGDRSSYSEGVAQLLTSYLSSYDPSQTRLIVQTSTASVYLIVGVAAPEPISAQCRRVLPTSWLRVVSLESQLTGSGPAYCLADIPSQSVQRSGHAPPAAFACSSFARAKTGFPSGLSALTPGGRMLALVPDGVGAVAIRFAGLSRTFSLSVRDNLADGTGPAIPGNLSPHGEPAIRRALNRLIPETVTWLAAPAGATVTTFARPADLLNLYVQLAEGA
jgi:hypothetical protein